MSFFQIGNYQIQVMSNGLYKVNNSYFLNPQQMMDDHFRSYLNKLWQAYEWHPEAGFVDDVNFKKFFHLLSYQDIIETELFLRSTRFVEVFNQIFGTHLSIADLQTRIIT